MDLKSCVVEYSIDNESSWQNNNIFTGLPEGSYNIWAKNQSGKTPYTNNLVEIQNIAAPQITNITTTPETNNNSDGDITIIATTTTDSLWYSINNGQNYQYDNGYFNGLPAGVYNCNVVDNFDCDTSFIVVITRTTTQLVEAIVGDAYTCVGSAATNPIIVSDFTGIKRFNLVLEYDASRLECEGYDNIIDELKDDITVTVITSDNKIKVEWDGNTPVTLPQNTTILDLVFTATEEGVPVINWEVAPGECSFYNESGDEIPASYTMGKVTVYTRPVIILGDSQSYCRGDNVNLWAFVDGGLRDISYHWDGPQGYSSDEEYLWLNEIQPEMAGIYTLEVQDTANCIEAKQIDIIVEPSPGISFSEYDTLWAEQGYILDAGNEGEYYLWNTGETSSTIVIDTAGEYSVLVTSYDGCKSTDSVHVLWDTSPFILPNAFTPNGDGLNDTYGVIARYSYAKLYSLSIFNRWGQKIFESSNISDTWDGTYNGSPCTPGSYVVRVAYREYDNQLPLTKIQQGTVMLIR